MSYSPTPLASTDAQLRQSSIMNQVYAWMTAGLLVTGAVAAYTANSPNSAEHAPRQPLHDFHLIYRPDRHRDRAQRRDWSGFRLGRRSGCLWPMPR